jgi:hypothetical protein
MIHEFTDNTGGRGPPLVVKSKMEMSKFGVIEVPDAIRGDVFAHTISCGQYFEELLHCKGLNEP